jgi:tetratricopeptide (TPR) repeat protein
VGRPRDALLELAAAERLRPADPAAALARGNLLLALDDPERAVEAFREATVRRPDWPGAHIQLGRAHERLGRLETAEEQYVRALEIDPSHAGARAQVDRLRALRNGAAEAAPP